MSLEHWLVEVWYGDRRSGRWLAPLGMLMRAVTWLRQILFRRGWLHSTKVAVPVIVIGNITAGGTGKTPLVIWLVNRLSLAGLRVGVLTRGYRRKTHRRLPLAVSDAAPGDPSLIGDEAALIARKTGAAVVVGPERVSGARRLERDGVQVIVCDDGLQHYRLDRSAEIAVIDGQRGVGNGRFIPAGPLRESLKRLRTVTAVVINGKDETRCWPGALTMKVVGRKCIALSGDEVRPLAELAGKQVHAVAGIGNPHRFFDMLEANGIEIRRHVFPDHAHYAADDIEFDDDWPILMTEKDAVKCVDFATDRMWSVPVEVEFSKEDDMKLCRLIAVATGLKLDDALHV